MSEYENQANDFAKKHGVKLTELSMRVGSMWSEKEYAAMERLFGDIMDELQEIE